MAKTGTILSVEFKNEYQPAKDILYVHHIELDNGDKGNVYKPTKYPQDIAQGAIITYEQKVPGKTITIISETAQQSQSSASSKPAYSGGKKSYAKKPDDFIGYAAAYAKDFVIAGKVSSSDMEDYRRIVTFIYNDIKQKLQEDK